MTWTGEAHMPPGCHRHSPVSPVTITGDFSVPAYLLVTLPRPHGDKLIRQVPILNEASKMCETGVLIILTVSECLYMH